MRAANSPAIRGPNRLEAESAPIAIGRLYEIEEQLNPPPEESEEEPEPEESEDDPGQEEAQAEAETILDGPPPDLPPSAEPPSPTDFTLAQFDKAVKSLAELHTKSVRKFIGSAHSGDDLRKIANFLCSVADITDTLDDDQAKTLRRIGADSWAPIEEGASA